MGILCVSASGFGSLGHHESTAVFLLELCPNFGFNVVLVPGWSSLSALAGGWLAQPSMNQSICSQFGPPRNVLNVAEAINLGCQESCLAKRSWQLP